MFATFRNFDVLVPPTFESIQNDKYLQIWLRIRRMINLRIKMYDFPSSPSTNRLEKLPIEIQRVIIGFAGPLSGNAVLGDVFYIRPQYIRTSCYCCPFCGLLKKYWEPNHEDGYAGYNSYVKCNWAPSYTETLCCTNVCAILCHERAKIEVNEEIKRLKEEEEEEEELYEGFCRGKIIFDKEMYTEEEASSSNSYFVPFLFPAFLPPSPPA